MQLQWLYYFVTIAELEHYTRAAEKLKISQSNLSHAIKSMERELGAELFERQERNVKLNKYGKLFLPYAQKSLNTLEAGENALKEYIDPNSGTIIIGGFYSIEAFTTDLMIRYHSETNRLGVQFQYSSEGWFNLQKHLLDGSMDLILCTKVNSPRVGSYYIGSHPLVALVSEQHRFAQRSSLKLEDFQGENFISFDSSGQISSRMKEIFEQKHLHVNIVTETPNDVIIYGLVAAGHGIAVVPYPLSGAPYGTKVIPIADEAMTDRPLYLQWNKDRYIPPAAEFFKNYIMRSGDVLNQYFVRHGISFTADADQMNNREDPTL